MSATAGDHLRKWFVSRAGGSSRRRKAFPKLRLVWQRRFTPAGRILFIVFALSGAIASAISVSQPLYYFAAFLFAVLLVERIAGWRYRPRLRLERTLPERSAAGATVLVRALAANLGKRPAYDLAASERNPPDAFSFPEKHAYLDMLKPGESRTLQYAFTPMRRGAYDFTGPIALSAFPFGLYYSACPAHSPHRMLVYPRFAPLASVDLPAGRKHQPGGLQLVSQVGESEEFIGNREYRPGDRLRDIDHLAWARHGFPVVREYQQEYLCRIALVVDTYVPDTFSSAWRSVRRKRGENRTPAWQRLAAALQGKKPAEESETFEAAVSLAAAVADALSRQEYVIDLFAAGPELYHLQAGRSLAYLDNILDVLACIEPCRTNPFDTLAPAIMEELGRISTLVIVMQDWDAQRERFVQSIRDAGVAVKLVVVHDGDPARDPRAFSTEAGAPQVFTPAEIRNGLEAL